MGADARRKDARKRKFRRTQHFSPVAAPQTSSDAGDAARTPKCAKPMSPTDGATSANEAEREPDNARTTDATGDEGTDRGEGRPQETTHTQASRFVCFVGMATLSITWCRSSSKVSTLGNLPFTTTQISLTQHFAKIKPSAIRHRTSKDTGKSKGFAFVEFGCYDRMKTCLQLYHHSAFNDGLSPARLINVELT